MPQSPLLSKFINEAYDQGREDAYNEIEKLRLLDSESLKILREMAEILDIIHDILNRR